MVRRVPHGPFGVDPVLADAIFDLAAQVAVFEHHQMGLENVGAFGAESLAKSRHRLVHLALGDTDRFTEPFDLSFDLMFWDKHPHDSTARVINQKYRPDRDALANADALISVFGNFSR